MPEFKLIVQDASTGSSYPLTRGLVGAALLEFERRRLEHPAWFAERCAELAVQPTDSIGNREGGYFLAVLNEVVQELMPMHLLGLAGQRPSKGDRTPKDIS